MESGILAKNVRQSWPRSGRGLVGGAAVFRVKHRCHFTLRYPSPWEAASFASYRWASDVK